jgi:hypothetical protein
MERPPYDEQSRSQSQHRGEGPGSPERDRPEPLIPEVLEPGEEEYRSGQSHGIPFGGGPDGLFGPRSFGGGRVQVWGCSPGCLIVSLVVSVVLSVVLTLLLNAIF